MARIRSGRAFRSADMSAALLKQEWVHSRHQAWAPNGKIR